MSQRLTGSGCLLILIGLCGCDLPSGSSGVAPATKSPQTHQPPPKVDHTFVPPTPSATTVELSEGSVKRTGDGVLNVFVKYRFVSGRPDARNEYTLQMLFPGAPVFEMRRLPGADLKPEGVIEFSFRPYEQAGLKPNKKLPEPMKFEMQFMEPSPSVKGRSEGRSNWLRGDIQ